MEPDGESSVRFCPSRAEGLPDVREVVVCLDRLEVNTSGQWVTFPFRAIGRRQEPAVRSFLKRLIGRAPWARVVGERDWCRAPQDRFFRWYTSPQLTTFMPESESRHYAESLFPRIHQVLSSGGYCTFDLA
jgi:hypothetical protein